METKDNVTITPFADGSGFVINVSAANVCGGLCVSNAQAESLVALLSAQLQDAERAQVTASTPQRLACVSGNTPPFANVTADDINADIANGFTVYVKEPTKRDGIQCRVMSAEQRTPRIISVRTRYSGAFDLSADAQIWSV